MLRLIATLNGNPVDQTLELHRPIGQMKANRATIALIFSDSRSVALTTIRFFVSCQCGDSASAIVAEELYGQRLARPEF